MRDKGRRLQIILHTGERHWCTFRAVWMIPDEPSVVFSVASVLAFLAVEEAWQMTALLYWILVLWFIAFGASKFVFSPPCSLFNCVCIVVADGTNFVVEADFCIWYVTPQRWMTKKCYLCGKQVDQVWCLSIVAASYNSLHVRSYASLQTGAK